MMQTFNRKKGIHTSGSLFIFWILLSICSAINIYSLLSETLDTHINEIDKSHIEVFTIVTTISYMPIVLIQMVLSCFSDASSDKTTKVNKTQ
jgi:ATP-binding cassette subfamily C (CFTR/MRP) protein 1